MAQTVQLEERLVELDDRGYTVLEGVLDDEFLGHAISTIERLERELGVGPGIAVPGEPGSARALFEAGSSRVRSCLRRDPVFERIATQPVLMQFLEMVLGPKFLLSNSMVSLTLNGRSDGVNPSLRPQPIHADDYYIPLARPYPMVTCQTLWALSEFTEDNGATRVIPGSHKFSVQPDYRVFDWKPEDGEPAAVAGAIPLVMPPGSVAVLHSSLWHGAGENTTDERRFGLSALYCPGWVRPVENMQLGLPVEKLRSFDSRLQELLGVRGRYGGYVGHIDFADPQDHLFGG